MNSSSSAVAQQTQSLLSEDKTQQNLQDFRFFMDLQEQFSIAENESSSNSSNSRSLLEAPRQWKEFQKKSLFQLAMEHSKSQMKPILAVLHSRKHDQIENFCKKILCRKEFKDFVENRFFVLLLDVLEKEGHTWANKLKISAFPFFGVFICPFSASADVSKPPKLELVWKFEPNFNMSYLNPNFYDLDAMIARMLTVYEESKSKLEETRRKFQDEEIRRLQREEQGLLFFISFFKLKKLNEKLKFLDLFSDIQYHETLEKDREILRNEAINQMRFLRSDFVNSIQLPLAKLHKKFEIFQQRYSIMEKLLPNLDKIIAGEKPLNLGKNDICSIRLKFPNGKNFLINYPKNAKVVSLFEFVHFLGIIQVFYPVSNKDNLLSEFSMDSISKLQDSFQISHKKISTAFDKLKQTDLDPLFNQNEEENEDAASSKSKTSKFPKKDLSLDPRKKEIEVFEKQLQTFSPLVFSASQITFIKSSTEKLLKDRSVSALVRDLNSKVDWIPSPLAKLNLNDPSGVTTSYNLFFVDETGKSVALKDKMQMDFETAGCCPRAMVIVQQNEDVEQSLSNSENK